MANYIVHSSHDWLRSTYTSVLADSSGRDSCQPVCARPCANRNLDHCAELDGSGVYSQCKAVRTHPLPVHRPILCRDDRAGQRAWFWLRLRRHVRLGSIGRRHSSRKQNSVVGDRACLGQLLSAKRAHATFESITGQSPKRAARLSCQTFSGNK